MALEYRVWFDPQNTGRYIEERDLTPWLESAEWKIGRDSPKTLEEVSDPGVMVLTLFNWDDQFDINNRASPYHFTSRTPLVPLVSLYIEARRTGQSAWTRLASMKLADIIPVQQGSGLKIARLTAYGIFAALNTINARISVEPPGVRQRDTDEGTGSFVRRILETVLGNPSTSLETADWTLDEGLTRLPYSYLYNGTIGRFRDPQPALQGLRYLEKVEIGRLMELRDGRVAFRDRRWRWKRRGSPVASINNTNPGGTSFSVERLEPRDSWKDVYNRITVAQATIEVTQDRVLWEYSDPTIFLPRQISGGETLSFPVVPDFTALEGEQQDVLNWRPPALASAANWGSDPDIVVSSLSVPTEVEFGKVADSNWDLGQAPPNTTMRGRITLQGDLTEQEVGINLATTDQVALNLTESEGVARLEITNLTGQPLFLWLARVRGNYSFIYDRTEDTIQDDTSIQIYGLKEWQYPVELLRRQAGDVERLREEARDHLRELLLVYRQPRQHIKVAFHANTGDLEERAVLEAGVGVGGTGAVDDLITVTDAAEGLANEFYWIDYEKHRLTADGDHLVEWGLVDAYTSTPGAVVGEPWWTAGAVGSVPGTFHRVGF